jgi:hypothetical protein
MVGWVFREDLGLVNRESGIMRINAVLSNNPTEDRSVCTRIAFETAKHGKIRGRSKLNPADRLVTC